LLQLLNRSLVGTLSSDRFVTAVAIEIDAVAGTLTVANAAHVPVVLRREGRRARIVGRASGPPLGILSDSSYFEETCSLGCGDLVVLMTDGVVEAVESDLAGMPRLTALVETTQGDGDAVHQRLLEQLSHDATGRAPDDMTLLSLELRSGPRQCRPPAAA
jgi:serine phosphatase RsbU (regulator of sigma subunit)